MSDRPRISKVCHGVYTCGHGLLAIRHTMVPIRPHLIRPGVGWTVYMDGKIVCNAKCLHEAAAAMEQVLNRRAAAILEGHLP